MGREKATLFRYSNSMQNIDTDKLYVLIDKFAKDRDWDQFHSIKNLSMAMNVECSELLEIFQWMTEKQSNSLDSKELVKVKEELADIFIYLIRISGKLNLNLEEIALEKINQNARKYPVEKSKGNSKKYTDL